MLNFRLMINFMIKMLNVAIYVKILNVAFYVK